MKIQLAKPEHIDAWMVLVDQVRNAFPGLETAEAMAAYGGGQRQLVRR